MHNNSYTSLWRGKYEVCMVDKACQLLFPRKPLTQLQRQTLGVFAKLPIAPLISTYPKEPPETLTGQASRGSRLFSRPSQAPSMISSQRNISITTSLALIYSRFWNAHEFHFVGHYIN
jgi:hypothetical protein